MKFVIGKWRDQNGQEYASLDMVYQSVDQLRERDQLTLDHPPMVFPLKLRGLTETTEGLYPISALYARFRKALSAYDALSRSEATAPENAQAMLPE